MLIRHRLTACLAAAAALVLGGCASLPNRPTGSTAIRLANAAGEPVRAVTIGENVEIGASGLTPGQGYEFDLMLGERRVGFARAAADRRGEIAPLILWYQSGVIGCSGDWRIESARRPVAFRSFDEAESALNGQTLQLRLREAVPPDRRDTRARNPFRPTQGRLLASQSLPATRSAAPQIYPSTAEGCLLNSAEAGTRDMYVSGRGFTPGEAVELTVAPNQVEWHVGDAVPDESSGTGRVRVRAGADGRFTTRVWDRTAQRQGAFDVLAHRLDLVQGDWRHILPRDVISYGHDTAYILFLYYPPGGTQMDIAGRTLAGSPYFQFADSFATTDDDVWGGVDPTYVQPAHPGGAYAAYHVVNHRGTIGPGSWANVTNLADLTGVVEVAQVKAGCINVTYREIWSAPLPVGDYDVVVNFGSVPAASQAAYVEDFNYDTGLDYLDGAIQIGFVVAPDPNELSAQFAVGETSYSVDDVLTLSPAVSAHHGPNQPNGPNVDLRAVVRYPATAAGVDTPVAPGVHPIFVMQHGNHSICNVAGSHTTCPPAQRKRNHEGYMRLLDVLASYGIIAVSVDAFDVTGIFDQWIPERADLNLKHLEFWSHLNDPTTYPVNAPFAAQTNMANRFTGSVDLTKVSVSGHSRGGEASVSTYVRNLMRPIAQQFGIGSVSSIAPVDGVNSYVLGNVPYFVILPSADGDVASLSGARIYDRAGTATDLTVKSGIDVYGANHNFFNTIWAADGEEGGADSPRPFEMLAPDQQKIGESYIAAFVLSHLRGMTVYEDMLRGRLTFPSTAPGTIYHFRHETPFLKLDNGTSATPVATGLNASTANGFSVHTTSAKLLNWNANGQTYTYTLGAPVDVSGFEVLSFRAAQSNAAVNPLGATVQFQLRLASGATTRTIITGRFDPIPPVYDRPSWPADQNVLTTVRVPLHSFIMNVVNPNPFVDLTAIDTIELKFFTPNQGEIYVDDVEFSR